MELSQNAILERIDKVLNSTTSGGDVFEHITTLAHLIQTFAPPGSSFRARLTHALDAEKRQSPAYAMQQRIELRGILKSLRNEHEAGYLETVQELVHADIFSDFLEMAQYLLSENYKDPAAVLAGGVLEEHLRKLCVKHGVPTDDPKDGKPRKSDSLNAELAKASAYDKLPQKSVIEWLDLRNKAAHGKYTQYDSKQVELMLEGVRHFIEKYRA